MKDHISYSDTFFKHNELIVAFEPCELVKEYTISIDMGSSNCSCPSSSCPSYGTNCCKDSTFLIILVALLISYLNRGDLEF